MISDADSLEDCHVSCTKYDQTPPFEDTGTLLRIYGLKNELDDEKTKDLRDNLSRLVSPFSLVENFTIHLESRTQDEATIQDITAPEFLSSPPYRLKGRVDQSGAIACEYVYDPIRKDIGRTESIEYNWYQILHSNAGKASRLPETEKAECGQFKFELRVWDVGADDVGEIADNYEVKKNFIRSVNKAHKGVSVYRDGILVLPKSDSARDWLGLDLRRISKLGTRLSTSQLVGLVSISADGNPGIADTSDREKLVSTPATKELELILHFAVELLETERDRDRDKKHTKQKKLTSDLFLELSAEKLLQDVSTFAEEGASASEVVPLIQEYHKAQEKVIQDIQERFVFYSRLATIGTIAQMLIHEIRNKTTVLGAFQKSVLKVFKPLPEKVEEYYQMADQAIDSLESLADRFAPLASRSFKKGKRRCILSGRIEACLALHKKDLDKLGIVTKIPSTDWQLAVDPGELDAVLVNLISNTVYWLSQSGRQNRILEFRSRIMTDGSRLRIFVDDSGPGIKDEDIDKILLPGITRKPGGIGMGLTVAAEIVSGYDGRMEVKHPGTLGGASFIFDLPISK